MIDLDAIARAGRALARVLDHIVPELVPGVRTIDVDAMVRRAIAAAGAEPVVAIEPDAHGRCFPGACAVNINEEAAAAPPGPRALRPGDLVTLDVALRLDGWCADAARAIVLKGDGRDLPRGWLTRERGDQRQALARGAAEVTAAVIARCWPGARVSELASTARVAAAERGLTLVPGFGGHGVGRSMHEPPSIDLCTGNGGLGVAECEDLVLRRGMVLTIEPILTLARRGEEPRTVMLDDGWTVAMAGREDACSVEHTIAITADGARVLTVQET